MDGQQKVLRRIFKAQGTDGFWKVLPESHKYYPDLNHYVPNFRSTLWTMILLADLGVDPNDPRIKKPLNELQNHFFDYRFGIYSLKKAHFPIPCLNGNMLYLDGYFNDSINEQSARVLDFFYKNQRFDDGSYKGDKNKFCSNTSCYGKHSCYWGVTKLFKGISFIPKQSRTKEIKHLLNKCIQFVLLHKVCFSSHNEGRIMIKRMDKLTFPNMYKSDFLELLWLLKREQVTSDKIEPAMDLLKSKQGEDGTWNLERKMHNIITSVGQLDQSNPFITQRASEVLSYYGN